MIRALGVAFALGAALAQAGEPVVISGRAMGTTWRVSWRGASATDADALHRRITERLEALEQIFSTYRPSSEISRLNAHRQTAWFAASREFVRVAAECRRVSLLTGGAFDVTVAPLVARWGFGPAGDAAPPEEATLAAVRELVDYRKLEVRVEPPALRKTDPRLTVDFSSMAKGFAADEVSALLAIAGVTEHLVQIGGDLKSHGGTWRVGVERPGDAAGKLSAVLEISDGAALSTSGDARNAIAGGGRSYGHIIDPRSGRPVESNVASVSVTATSCARSSALATAMFVLGAEEGMRLAQREGMAVMFLMREGEKIVPRATGEFEKWRVSSGR